MFEDSIRFIREVHGTTKPIMLNEPFFDEAEFAAMAECLRSTFVSSVGPCIGNFETKIAEFCGVKRAVACVNGTSALHLALLLAGVNSGDQVITQPLTFIATANAISYCGATPIFVDVDKSTMGLSPEKLDDYLKKNVGIKAVVPMHTFGHPCKMDEIKTICERYGIKLIEDCAESLGSFYKGIHMGNFGEIGVLSFNGNKIITSGGGGMLLFNDDKLADRAKHLTTQAKIPHRWNFSHDAIGFNYRMPNLNAALGLAQFGKLEIYLQKRRQLAQTYKAFFRDCFVDEPVNARSNFWLQAIRLDNRKQRDQFLQQTNDNGIMTRPAWTLMHKLSIYKNSRHGDLSNAEWLENRLVNIPSGVTL